MKNYKIFDLSILGDKDRWLINSLLSTNTHQDIFGKSKLISLNEVLTERKESIDPQEFTSKKFNYLGLENIQPFTGFIVGFTPKYGKEIKSRCKVFQTNDFLFSKLRPTLNKCTVIDESFDKGICSSEFLVFKIDESVFNPLVLKFLISMNYVQKQIENYIAGTALPRIQTKDFLSIKIPLIPKTLQDDLSLYLEDINYLYKQYFLKLNNYENDLNNSLLKSILENRLIKIED